MYKAVEYDSLVQQIQLLKQENEALKAENQKFISAVENSPATIVISDLKGIIEYANQGFTEITGYTISEVIGKPTSIVKSGHHDRPFYATLWKTIKSGNVWRGEFYNRKKNGEYYWEQAHIAPIKNSSGDISNFVAIKFDITKKKESENYLNSILRAIPELIFVVDQAGWFHDILSSDEVLLRLAQQQMRDKCLSEVFPQDIAKNLMQLVHKTIEENSVQIIEYKMKSEDSKVQWFEGRSAPLGIEVAGKKCAVIVARDITSRKKTEQELKELNATKDKFFTILAHDLKNPFSAILSFSGMLSESISNNEREEALQISKIINTSAHNTYNLLENLLDWARSQTGKLVYKPQDIHLHDLVSGTVSLLESQAIGKQVLLVNRVPEQIAVYADNNLLKTIIRNLVSNAIKFTGAGGKVLISAEKTDGCVEITVFDTGVGIHPDELKKLFNLDSKYISRGTSQETGTGLGLLLCKEFVERQGGTIWVESEPGKGSRFKFTVPDKEIGVRR